MVARLLQLAHQIVDVCNRGGSELLNDGRDLRVSLWLRSRLCASKIANVAFSHQVRGYSLEVRHLKFHKMIPSSPNFHYLRRGLMGGEPSGPTAACGVVGLPAVWAMPTRLLISAKVDQQARPIN